jgi:polyprenyl-phospho-N-acetylgalactosaminyl synthase
LFQATNLLYFAVQAWQPSRKLAGECYPLPILSGVAPFRSTGVVENSCVFVVIPAYNENAVLRSTVLSLLPFGYSIVIVDDGSATPARRCVEGLNVYCVRHDINLGQGAALQTGSSFALLTGARIIVHFDADGQHGAEMVERLIDPIVNGRADVVLGSRFLNPCDRREVPFEKQLVLKAGVFVSWIFTGLWLSDTHNGLRALSHTAADRITLKENGFAHATEILDLLRRSKLRYSEVPVSIRYTAYSRKKGQSLFNSCNILIDLVLRRLLG